MTNLGCLGLIQSRFRLFWPNLRPILACFGRFSQFRPPADTIQFSQYDLILTKSTQIGANWSQVGTNLYLIIKNNKNKKTQTQHRRVERRCGTHFATSVHYSAYLLHVYKETSTGKTATKFHLSLILLEALNTKY